MPYLNTFRVGADPEFIILRDGHMQLFQGGADQFSPWGLDHGGWVIEPHPKPAVSVREVVQNLKVAMNDFALRSPEGTWRSGAYYNSPERRITLGGHVHIDMPRCSAEVRGALDEYTQYLEALDILPREESRTRRVGSGYGAFGDVRNEHGHFEYRSMCSWLFSQRATKLSLLGGKLLACEPAARTALGAVREASIPKLRGFFEQFRHRDDDVDWLLTSGILKKRLVVNPDRDLREVWRVVPGVEDPHWKQQENYGVPVHINPQNTAQTVSWSLPNDFRPTVPAQYDRVDQLYDKCFDVRGWIFKISGDWTTGAEAQLANNWLPSLAISQSRSFQRGDAPSDTRIYYQAGLSAFSAEGYAIRGGAWTKNFRTTRVSINRVRHTFWTLPSQTDNLASVELNRVLREAIQTHHYTPADGVQLHEGLMFKVHMVENAGGNEEI